MKFINIKKLVILILFFVVHYSFGQACGTYQIKYIGQINSKSVKVKEVELPTISFLHNSNKNIGNNFVEVGINDNKINVKIE